MEREQIISMLVCVCIGGLFIFLAYAVYQLLSLFKKYALVKTAWESSLNIIISKSKKRKTIEKESYSLYGEMETKSLAGKIDGALAYSGITAKYSRLTAEMFIAGILVISLLEIILVLLFFHNLFIAVALVGITWIVMREVVSIMRSVRMKKINDELLQFEDLMRIFAATNTSILQIMGKAAIRIKGPLQEEVFSALSEAESSGKVSLALRRLCNRVENNYFKDLILNMDIASKHTANYGEILQESISILKREEQNRKKIQKLYQKSGMYIAVFLILAIGCILAIGAFAGVDNIIATMWETSILSRGIFIYISVVMLFCLWRTLSRIVL